jgi:hypothetical protein
MDNPKGERLVRFSSVNKSVVTLRYANGKVGCLLSEVTF